jgi:hypothetical protein
VTGTKIVCGHAIFFKEVDSVAIGDTPMRVAPSCDEFEKKQKIGSCFFSERPHGEKLKRAKLKIACSPGEIEFCFLNARTQPVCHKPKQRSVPKPRRNSFLYLCNRDIHSKGIIEF